LIDKFSSTGVTPSRLLHKYITGVRQTASASQLVY